MKQIISLKFINKCIIHEEYSGIFIILYFCNISTATLFNHRVYRVFSFMLRMIKAFGIIDPLNKMFDILPFSPVIFVVVLNS